MSRHPDPGLDPRIADWLEADPDHAPPDVMRTVESAIPSIPQRRALRLPWRTLPVNRPILSFATLALLTVVGVGAVAVGSRPSTTTPVQPAPTAPALANDSPSPTMSLNPYRAARNEICDAAIAEKGPLAARYGLLYDGGATAAQQADGVAALEALTSLNDRVTADLMALPVPDDIRNDHVANVTQYRDVTTLIRHSLSLRSQGKLVEAAAVDESTNLIADQIAEFEANYNLRPCP